MSDGLQALAFYGCVATGIICWTVCHCVDRLITFAENPPKEDETK